jgi:putative PIN family toxin of toxin-antitoxin system
VRVVLDTNVMVAALRSAAGASAELLRAAHGGGLDLVATVALFAEYEAVLTRPEHLLVGGVSAAEVAAALDSLAAHVAPVDPHFSWRPLLTDPDDEMVLEAAINGGATAIVTMEIATFLAAAAKFGVEVLTPRAALAKLRQRLNP